MWPSPSITLCIASPFPGRRTASSLTRLSQQRSGVVAFDQLEVVTGQTGHVPEDRARRVGHERVVGADHDALPPEHLQHEGEGVRREHEQVDEEAPGEIARPYRQSITEDRIEVPH